MKLFLNEDAIRKILKERGKPVHYIGEILEVSRQATYDKLNNKAALDVKQVNKLCEVLVVSAESILTEDSMNDLDEHRKELEYMDTLNAQY